MVHKNLPILSQMYILGQLAVTGEFEGLVAITQDTLMNEYCHWV